MNSDNQSHQSPAPASTIPLAPEDYRGMEYLCAIATERLAEMDRAGSNSHSDSASVLHPVGNWSFTDRPAGAIHPEATGSGIPLEGNRRRKAVFAWASQMYFEPPEKCVRSPNAAPAASTRISLKSQDQSPVAESSIPPSREERLQQPQEQPPEQEHPRHPEPEPAQLPQPSQASSSRPAKASGSSDSGLAPRTTGRAVCVALRQDGERCNRRRDNVPFDQFSTWKCSSHRHKGEVSATRNPNRDLVADTVATTSPRPEKCPKRPAAPSVERRERSTGAAGLSRQSKKPKMIAGSQMWHPFEKQGLHRYINDRIKALPNGIGDLAFVPEHAVQYVRDAAVQAGLNTEARKESSVYGVWRHANGSRNPEIADLRNRMEQYKQWMKSPNKDSTPTPCDPKIGIRIPDDAAWEGDNAWEHGEDSEQEEAEDDMEVNDDNFHDRDKGPDSGEGTSSGIRG